MVDIAGSLQNYLNTYERVVFVDEGFAWKELALSKLKDSPGIGVVTEPEFMRLYRMYEFSDKFVVLSESSQYGSIWNYVRLGKITAEDALEQVLGA